MENELKLKIGLAIFDIAGIVGLVYFINNGWVDAIVYTITLLLTIVGCALIISSVNEPPVNTEKSNATPIYSVPLRKMGFRYDEDKDKWLLGGDGASFLVRLGVRTLSDGKSVGFVECFNFAKEKGGTLSYFVTSMEEVRFVMSLCGIITSD